MSNIDNTKNKMLLLDMDGTVTDFKTKQIAFPEILPILSSFIKNGGYLAVVTGRAIKWVEETFIKHIFPLVYGDDNKRIFVVGEFGATWKGYSQEGMGEEIVDKKYLLPEGMYVQLSQVATQFSKSMFWDKAKKVIFTVEVVDGYPLEEFSKDGDIFEKEARAIVEKAKTNKKILVVPSIIAVDVKDARLNKVTGTQRVFKWIDEEEIPVDKCIAIGDQPFDADMAKVAVEHGHKASLVYLGENNLEQSLNFPVEITKNKYTKGLLEFLEEFNL